MKDIIICLVGESGSGKTAVSRRLYKLGYNVIQSYTTREPRRKDEWGHIFKTLEDYNNAKESGDILAHTYFDGNYYWAQRNQYIGKGVTLYAVDPKGADELRKITKDAEVVVVYIKVDESERVLRMLRRYKIFINNRNLHDFYRRSIKRTHPEVMRRIEHDRKNFKFIRCDYVIDNNNNGIEETISIIKGIIENKLNDGKNTS